LWEATLGRTDAPIELKGEPLDGGWHLTFGGPATLKSGRGSFASKLGATVAIDEHNRLGRIERADLAVDLADVAVEDVTLKEGRVDLSVEGTSSSLDGNLTLALDGFSWRTPGLRVQDVRAQRTFDLTLRDHLLSLVPATDGEKISIGKFAIGDELETGWFTSPWPASDQPWLRIDLDRGRFDHRFEGVIDPVRIDIGSNRIWARIEDLTTSFTGTLSGMEKGRVLIKQGRIDMPAADLALVGIESDIPFNHDGLVGDQTIPLTIRLLRPLDQPYWFVPVRLDTEVRSTENEVSFSGQARTKTQPAVPVDLAGNHDLIHGRGSLDIKHAPFAFAVGGLQPADLIPSLDGALEDVAGSLALDGRIGWNDGDLSGNLALLIEELGFAIGPARLERINGVIQFDDVEPLSTPPDQLLSIALLDVGIPLTDGLVEMQLRRDGQLAVDQLAWRLADGKVRADPFTFGSDVQDLTMVLKADALDLNALLGLTALDGLSGEGRINGAVPLTISEAAAAISKGEFAAAAPGILRYRPDQAPGVLQAGGESVRLMLQALENFHYDALRITLDGQTDGATDIGLHLKGANPELYDGHPLEFNFNLEGNLASLIQANLDNYQIPDRVSERLQGFGR
ncbi:MAG: intermembrane phospholipid transport protein YdbH family protein, partial [Geminicoccaceae bacterium]